MSISLVITRTCQTCTRCAAHSMSTIPAAKWRSPGRWTWKCLVQRCSLARADPLPSREHSKMRAGPSMLALTKGRRDPGNCRGLASNGKASRTSGCLDAAACKPLCDDQTDSTLRLLLRKRLADGGEGSLNGAAKPFLAGCFLVHATVRQKLVHSCFGIASFRKKSHHLHAEVLRSL